MVALPRNQIVDKSEPGFYHCYSRCVRRSFLCGQDDYTGRDFSHRREWIEDRLEFLASAFAIDVNTYAILQNHLHLVLRNRPDLVRSWSNEEILRRSRILFPSRFKEQGVLPGDPMPSRLLENLELIEEMRDRLSDISWFMRKLLEWIAKRANAEDGEKGHFWQARFDCQRLLDELAILLCCMYVDLNVVRAGEARTPEESRFTSVYRRIQARQARARGDLKKAVRHDGWLAPLQIGGDHHEYDGAALGLRASNDGFLDVTLDKYLELLDVAGRVERADKRGRIPEILPPILHRLAVAEEGWVELVGNFGTWFRSAVGDAEAMRQEADRLGRAWLQGMRRAATLFRSTASRSD